MPRTKDIFEFVGGALVQAVFDNATQVGQRLSSQVYLSELFHRFAALYGLSYTFTNPYSGNEKGNVENKAGYLCHNFFVPAPSFHNIKAFNRLFLDDHLAASDHKRHYRLGAPELHLFQEDKESLYPLAPVAFSCLSWVSRKCNKQGVFTLEGIHHYSAGPGFTGREVVVALGAFNVCAFDTQSSKTIAAYKR